MMGKDMKILRGLSDYPGSAAVVLGAHINGLGIIRSLGREGIPLIAIDRQAMMGQYSRFSTRHIVLEDNHPREFLESLCRLGSGLGHKAVLYITDDRYFRVCAAAAEMLAEHFYLPFNTRMGEAAIDKAYQYRICRENLISCPLTFIVTTGLDVENLLKQRNELPYPLIIKPGDQSCSLSFSAGKRLYEMENQHKLLELAPLIEKNLPLLVCEVIPGEPRALWAYNAYCHQPGEVVAGWTAQKLSQRPYRHGSFTIMRSVHNPEVAEAGKAALRALQIQGPAEVEFKWNRQRGCFQYIETNPRHIQYNGLGRLAGVDLVLAHYYAAVGDEDKLRKWAGMQQSGEAFMVLAGQEMANVVQLPGRMQRSKQLFSCIFKPRRMWAIHDWEDLGPSLYYLQYLLKKGWRKNTGQG